MTVMAENCISKVVCIEHALRSIKHTTVRGLLSLALDKQNENAGMVYDKKWASILNALVSMS